MNKPKQLFNPSIGICLGLLLCLLITVSLTGCNRSSCPWTQDIVQFKNIVLETHPRFAHEDLASQAHNIQAKATFETAVEQLLQRLPYLTDAEIVVELHRTASILGDNHFDIILSQLEPTGETAIYPLSFRWLTDGFYLLTTVESFEHALNHRIAYINGREIDEVFESFRNLWNVENIYNAKSTFARLLNNPVMLDAIGLYYDKQVTFALTNADGALAEVTLTKNDQILVDTLTAVSFPIFPIHSNESDNLPMFMDIRGSNGTGHNWFYFIEKYEILYIRLELYMQNINPETGMFAPFVEDVKAAFETKSPVAVVIDARYNPGGDNAYLADLFEFLAQHTTPGMLFHFIDEGSMSASLLGAAHLKSLGATLVGQPIGQNTDFFGFHTGSSAPNTHESLFFSDLSMFDDADPDDYVTLGIGSNVYPYTEVITITVREILEMAQNSSDNPSTNPPNNTSTNHILSNSNILINIPNVVVSASYMYNLDLEHYTIRPHVLIDYTIRNWIDGVDPLLDYVVGLLR